MAREETVGSRGGRGARPRGAARASGGRTQSAARGSRTQSAARGSAGAKGGPGTRARTGSAARRLSSLDGLRTLAIAAIFLYHASCPWLPSGHMGVVVFLVLTGYLVTASLAKRLARTRTVAPVTFWRHRFVRVWPSMAVMVVGACALCVVFNHVLLTKLRPDIVPSLLFYDNWHYILSGQSYFEQIGSPSPLTPLWYVSVDAQLCVVWSLVLWVLSKVPALSGPKTARRVALGLAAASLVAMAVLYVPDADPSRVYYGTDTRAFSFFAGAWLALVWPLSGSRAMARGFDLAPGRAKGAVHVPPAAVQAAGAVSAVALVAVMVLVPADAPFFYYGGMGLVTVLSTVLLAALVVPGGLCGRVLGVAPLAWVGARSYGLYLWHYPLLLLLGASLATGAWPQVLLAAVLSLGLAFLSFRFVERPFQQGGVLSRLTAAGSRARIPAAAALALLLVAGIGLAVVPETTLVPQDAITSTGDSADAAKDLSQVDRRSTDGGEGSAEGGGKIDPADVKVPDGYFSLNAAPSQVENGAFAPLLIGDSVPGGCTSFDTWFPDGFMDSYIGRRPSQALSVLEDYVSQGALSDCLVMAAFSNTTATPEQLDQIVSAAGEGTHVYLVGTFNPEGFQDQQNANLQDCAARHDNVTYVDWPSVVSGHESEYLWDDRTHLRPEGGDAYLDTIARAIAPQVVSEGGTISVHGDDATDLSTQVPEDAKRLFNGLVGEAAALPGI